MSLFGKIIQVNEDFHFLGVKRTDLLFVAGKNLQFYLVLNLTTKKFKTFGKFWIEQSVWIKNQTIIE